MIAAWITTNLVFQGFVNGLVYALLAMGVVLVFRSTRVINFAVGDLGVPAAALLALSAGKRGWPFWPSVLACVVVGTLSGTVIELAVIRRLFKAPRVIVLVATIGVAQLAQAITVALPRLDTGKLQNSYPTAISGVWHPGRGVTVAGPQVMILIAVPILMVALWWLLSRSRFGESVRAAATNSDLARLTGVSPKMVSTLVWTVSGFISAVSVILIAADRGTTTRLIDIGPNTLLRAMAAALLGRMVSFPIAVLGGVIIGIGEAMVFFNFTSQTGLVEFLLFVVVLVLVSRGSRRSDTGGESFSFAPRVQAVPERLARIWWVRRLPWLLGALFFAVAAAVPYFIHESARQLLYASIVGFAICAISVTVLSGWAGQLSLGQMAFAGIGALSAAAFARDEGIDIGIGSHRLIQFSLPHWPFAINVLIGSVIASALAALVGLAALRVRGLLLAVGTMAFAITAQQYLYRRPLFTDGSSQTVRLRRGKIGPIDIVHRQRAYYLMTLVVLAVVMIIAARVRRSGIGRTIVGVRENEATASAYAVSPLRAKITAFAMAGFIAGLGGGVLGGLVQTFGPQERFFRTVDSIQLVAMVVIGGLGTLAGPIIGALWVVGLPAFWPRNDVVPLFTSSIGLLMLLLYMPGGFVQLGYGARRWLFDAIEKRLPPEPVKSSVEPPASLTRAASRSQKASSTNDDGTVLRTSQLTVRFGGIVAVNSVDFEARPGEVVGLIGTNGAGKSTLLNAIGGYVPSDGRVELLGREISRFDAPRRASVGLGRTFQAATLFPELTVRETVQLALEARQRTSFFGTVLYLPSATRLERRRAAEAAELIDYLGLGRYADRFIAELSTGTRRIVELAALLAVSPRVICLDEPTAGVAQREAEAFGPLIKRVQEELDATLVVIEHDLPLIMSISDRVYCMEAGAVIAEGTPDQVRNDPRVIASYLGTDERAIQRSGARA